MISRTNAFEIFDCLSAFSEFSEKLPCHVAGRLFAWNAKKGRGGSFFEKSGKTERNRIKNAEILYKLQNI